MLRAFCLLLLCQLAGEISVRAAGLPVPGPVLGLVLLVAILALSDRRGWLGDGGLEASSVAKVSAALIGMLGLLFVPAGAGVVQHLPLLRAHGLGLAAALVGSTVLTLVVTVWVFVGVSRLVARRRP
ncbi:MAG: CidA/LrgA family protein [Alsobacter sp.]